MAKKGEILNTQIKKILDKDEFSVGDRIRLARIGAGLGVEEMAHIRGIKTSTQYGYENGTCHYPVSDVSSFEDAVGIKRGTLMQDACILDGPQPEIIHVISRNTQSNPRELTKTSKYVEKVIREKIADGTYTGKLPSVRQLVCDFEVTFPTILRALSPLKQEGILSGNRRKGTSIISREAVVYQREASS